MKFSRYMKMKLLINFIKITLVYTFNIIGLVFLPHPVYISSQIQPDQVYHIEKSINKFNLTRTYDKNENLIRIQYDNDIIANTAMVASVYNSGNFIIDSTIINFNSNLYDNILGCVILHELFHSQSLFHNNITGSIMNWTLYVDKNGLILNDNVVCGLSQDDLDGFEYENNN